MPGKSWGFGPLGVSYRDSSDDDGRRRQRMGAQPPPPPPPPPQVYQSYDQIRQSTMPTPPPPPSTPTFTPPSQTPPPIQLSMTVPQETHPSVTNITGSFTTTFMPPGSPGVNFNIGKTCNHNNGCDSSNPVSAGQWTGRCYDHDNTHSAGVVCLSGNPASKCPSIGTVASGAYYGPNNQPVGSVGSNPSAVATLQCVYSSISNPFDPLTISAFTGTGATNLTGQTGMQKQYCDGQNYHDMTLGPCANFYTNVTGDFDFQQALRINEENPNGAWAAIAPYVAIIRRIATGSASVSTQIGQNLAQNMITQYCLVYNPNGWPDNLPIRQMINQWALNGGAPLPSLPSGGGGGAPPPSSGGGGGGRASYGFNSRTNDD